MDFLFAESQIPGVNDPMILNTGKSLLGNSPAGGESQEEKRLVRELTWSEARKAWRGEGKEESWLARLACKARLEWRADVWLVQGETGQEARR